MYAQPAAGTGVYFTDGANIKRDGVAGNFGTAAGTTLGTLAWNNTSTLNAANQFFYAGDYSASSLCASATTNSAPCNSGVYAFDPTSGAMTPVAVENTPSNFIRFGKVVGIVKGNDQRLYIADGSNGQITCLTVNGSSSAVATVGGFQDAVVVAQSPTGLFSASSVNFVGMIADRRPRART